MMLRNKRAQTLMEEDQASTPLVEKVSSKVSTAVEVPPTEEIVEKPLEKLASMVKGTIAMVELRREELSRAVKFLKIHEREVRDPAKSISDPVPVTMPTTIFNSVQGGRSEQVSDNIFKLLVPPVLFKKKSLLLPLGPKKFLPPWGVKNLSSAVFPPLSSFDGGFPLAGARVMEGISMTIGSTTSDSCDKENGVLLVEDEGVVRRAHKIKGVTSVMVARGALWNASIFRAEGKLSWEDVKREYLRKCILWDNDVKSTKQTLKEMIMHYSCLEFAEGKVVTKSQTLADLANLYGEEEYYQFITKNR